MDKWIMKYGTMRFQPHQINYILDETWEAFKVAFRNTIRYRFAKTNIIPLIPPNMITNTQACVASVQTSSKCINHITEDTLAPNNLQ